jgi:hypothetical protein
MAVTDTTNAQGFRFHNGLVIPPAPSEPTHEAHRFDPAMDEPVHSYDRKVSHAPSAHVMETMVEPADAHFRYQPGMYVYVHAKAFNTNALDALECLIDDVTNAPLEIIVTPCNHPELTRTVRQDQLSAPIWV